MSGRRLSLPGIACSLRVTPHHPGDMVAGTSRWNMFPERPAKRNRAWSFASRNGQVKNGQVKAPEFIPDRPEQAG